MLRILGGVGGTQPGVAIVDHYDRFGRAVTVSGFGTGVASLTLRPAPPATQPVMPTSRSLPSGPLSANRFPAAASAPTAAARYEKALKAAQPVRVREPDQGWTISD